MIAQKLFDLANKLREPGGEMGETSITLHNAGTHINTQENYIQHLKADLAALEAREGLPASARRIAKALEQAAMFGWGSVRGEDLGEDS